MKPRKSALKIDLFAADFHQQKLDQLGDPLLRIASSIDFSALAAERGRSCGPSSSESTGRSPSVFHGNHGADIGVKAIPQSFRRADGVSVAGSVATKKSEIQHRAVSAYNGPLICFSSTLRRCRSRWRRSRGGLLAESVWLGGLASPQK